MVTIKKIQNFFWHNQYAEHPVILANIDIGDAGEWNFASLPLSTRALIIKKFPAIEDKNITANEFLADLCLSMHREKFNVPLIKHAERTQFYFAAIDFYYALKTIQHSVTFLNELINNPNHHIVELLGILEDNCEYSAFDQSIRAMIKEAEKRGIPWIRVASELRDAQFGQGHLQKRMRETIVGGESVLGYSYAHDKSLTCHLLSSIGLPSGQYATIVNPEQAVARAKAIGFPVVLKPTSAGKGKDVIVGLTTPESVYNTAKDLLSRWPYIIIQSLFKGDDYRILVVAGKFVAAARREPASVIADGTHSIEKLIKITNSDPRRGKNFYKLLNTIIIDDEVRRVIQSQGFSLESIPPSGMKIPLRLAANLSAGGMPSDFTDVIHPDNKRLAVRAALACGLKVAGIDFVTPDISKSWHEVGGGICEVNSGVDLRPHVIANPGQDIVKTIFNTVFEEGQNGRIPTAIITGPEGGADTAKILDYILQSAGHIVGRATSHGITINDEPVKDGDFAGPSGAALILRDPTVTAAVFENSENNIINCGIYLDYCDVTAILGGTEDAASRKVVATARGKIILNAEEPNCLAIAKDFAPDRIILFASDQSSKAMQSHINAGGLAVTLSKKRGKEKIIICANGKTTDITKAVEGLPTHNLMAAAALAYGMNIPVKTIAKVVDGYIQAQGSLIEQKSYILN